MVELATAKVIQATLSPSAAGILLIVQFSILSLVASVKVLFAKLYVWLLDGAVGWVSERLYKYTVLWL